MEASELIKRYESGERDFSHLNLRGADLEKASLAGANLAGCDLRQANLREADLRGANLQRAVLGFVGEFTERPHYKIDHRALSAEEWAELQVGADLRGANLEGANLEGAILAQANLEGADLKRAILRGANLETANLKGANLEDADVEGANWLYVGLEWGGTILPDGSKWRGQAIRGKRRRRA